MGQNDGTEEAGRRHSDNIATMLIMDQAKLGQARIAVKNTSRYMPVYPHRPTRKIPTLALRRRLTTSKLSTCPQFPWKRDVAQLVY